MKKITMIKMQGCPYCAKAAQAVEELRAEQPAYAGVEIEIIDENEQPELAKAYAKDYYTTTCRASSLRGTRCTRRSRARTTIRSRLPSQMPLNRPSD